MKRKKTTQEMELGWDVRFFQRNERKDLLYRIRKWEGLGGKTLDILLLTSN